MAALGPFATHGASTLGVVANTVAFDEGRAWLNEVLDYLDGNRHLLDDLLAERLPGVRHTKPEGTYLAWLDCRGLGLPRAPSEFFAEQASVVMVDGSQCGEVGAGFVRLNFATTRALLTQMVTQLADAVARYNA
jgi:cystathionine beta-lyase